jgi:hypothetical protein
VQRARAGPGESDEQLGKGEGAAREIDPPYRDTIASGDESSMNAQGIPGLL